MPVIVTTNPNAETVATEATVAEVRDRIPALESGRLPVVLPAGAGGLTDDELRATAVPVSLTSVPSHAVTGPLTDAQLRATAVPVSGTFYPATQPVSGTVAVSNLPSASPFTFVSGKTAAPSASAVQCDTGQLAAGDYEVLVALTVSDTVAVGKGLVVEHRNAANDTTIRTIGGASPNGGSVSFTIPRITLATNERIRVIAGTANGAASSMYVSAIGRRLL